MNYVPINPIRYTILCDNNLYNFETVRVNGLRQRYSPIKHYYVFFIFAGIFICLFLLTKGYKLFLISFIIYSVWTCLCYFYQLAFDLTGMLSLLLSWDITTVFMQTVCNLQEPSSPVESTSSPHAAGTPSVAGSTVVVQQVPDRPNVHINNHNSTFSSNNLIIGSATAGGLMAGRLFGVTPLSRVAIGLGWGCTIIG